MNIEKLTEFLKLFESFENNKNDNNNHLESELIGCFVVVRTYSAGVHAGILKAKKGKEVRLKDAYRIWSWTQPKTNTGSLNAVAVYGVGEGSKIANKVDIIELTEAIEVIKASDIARKSIENGNF